MVFCQFVLKFHKERVQQTYLLLVDNVHNHKNKASMLHTRRGSHVSDALVERAVDMVQTSSPSYVLMASLDAARAQVDTDGCRDGQRIENLNSRNPVHIAVALSIEAREQITKIDGITLLEDNHLPYSQNQRIGDGGIRPMIDVTRITISFAMLNLSGYVAADLLREKHGVESELSTPRCVVFVVTGGNSRTDIMMLVDGLRCLASSYSQSMQIDTKSDYKAKSPKNEDFQNASTYSFVMPAMRPRDAFFHRNVSSFPLKEAIGRISGEQITLYPPGIPLTMPGELITNPVILKLKEAAASVGNSITITGASDPTLKTIKCLVMQKDE